MIWGFYLVSQGDRHKALFYQCLLRTRRLASAVNCGRKGRSDTRILKKNEKDTNWDGCGALLPSCDPLIVITAAHCMHK